MSRLSIGAPALLIGAALLFVGATGPAAALCKPGTPHCIKQGPSLGHFPVTVGNVGDCVGSTNDTCGLKTHAFMVTGGSSTPVHPAGSAGFQQ